KIVRLWNIAALDGLAGQGDVLGAARRGAEIPSSSAVGAATQGERGERGERGQSHHAEPPEDPTNRSHGRLLARAASKEDCGEVVVSIVVPGAIRRGLSLPSGEAWRGAMTSASVSCREALWLLPTHRTRNTRAIGACGLPRLARSRSRKTAARWPAPIRTR